MPITPARSGLPASVLRVARPSTVDLIAIELRNAIFSGALAVGSQLGEVDIATQLGVSRGPLREATQRLVQEGVLTSLPGRGLRVSVVPPEDIPDLYLARRAVEGEALRCLVAAGAASTLPALETALDQLLTASEGDDARAIGDADLAFHQVLVDAAGSRRLSQAMATLAIQTRIASFSAKDGYAVPATVSPTFRALLDALVAGDVDAAVAALGRQFDDAVARLTGVRDVETVETDTAALTAPLMPLDQLAAEPE
ncbi:GntR family transcriptional regulator [Microbacterium invictum]|uniref:DNA-binding GntR family transcriptional regulator n=1 Tax=Microbacterium invictum TaxID=515415 RepID=A0AA40VJZ3_9MICO|nr:MULTISPECIES: GntR family transcriptional regulator [Microbacterium]MBB4138209.1 DNA-binding GntR family transcriptional regulator [Microbacterium invictum]